jgi:hypothetical protein
MPLPTQEEQRLLTEYHCAVNIYYGLVVKWLGRYDLGIEDEERQRLSDRKDKAEQVCTKLADAIARVRERES